MIQGLKGEIENIVQRFKNPEDAVISISGRSEIINFIGREVSFPGKVIFKYGDGASVIEDLLAKRTDLIISNHREKTDDLTSKRLFVDEFFLAVPRKWNGGIETLSKALVERLLARPFLQYKNNDYVIDLVLKHFNISKQIEPKTVLPDWPSLIYLAEKEGGWVIAPTRYQNLSGNKLVKIAVPTSIVPKTEFYILYRKENFDKKWLAPTLDKIKDIFTIS